MKLLLHLMRAVEGLPVTVIASLGPGDAVDEPALGAVLQLFHHQPQLSPLDAAVVRRHVASMTGLPEDAPFTHACSAAIGGTTPCSAPRWVPWKTIGSVVPVTSPRARR